MVILDGFSVASVMKVLFLDIDGVLNGGLHPEHEFDWSLPEAVENLNLILASTGARVVLSSAWRIDGLETVARHLEGWGVKADFIGATPMLNHPEDVDGCAMPRARVDEIRSWLDDHPEVESFVVLDDSNIFEDLDGDLFEDAEIRSRFVHTDGKVGLTAADAAQAVRHLEA